MIQCYLCKKTVSDRSSYIIHLRDHNLSGARIFPTKCIDPNCKYEYLDLEQFNRHLREKHSSLPKKSIFNKAKIIENQLMFTVNERSDCKMNGIEEDDCERLFQTPNIPHMCQNIKKTIFEDFLYLKSKAQLGESMLNQIFNRFVGTHEKIVELLLKFLKLVADSWKDNNHDNDIFKFIEDFQILKESFKFMDNNYKQNKIIEDHHLYIKPERYLFGERVDTCFKKGKFKIVCKDNTYEYISITKTLKSLLESARIRDALLSFNTVDEELQPFLFANSDFWKKRSTIRIILYFDEIEIKNPLGDAAGTYKLGMFYFTIQNFTKKHNSNLNNIFLIAASFSDDLKKYGVNVILDRIVNEIKYLETEGIKVCEQLFNASICQFVGDNLSVHQIFNLKQNFIGSNICHLCNASVGTIQQSNREEQFIKVSRNEYDEKLEKILKDPNESSLYGIRNKCSLNDLTYFHTTNNYMFDLTHDIWEGVVPLELSLILDQFINNKKYFKLELLNDRIVSFNYGLIDCTNKPSTIRLSKGKLKVKQKAAKMKCLFRNLSFLIGDRVPIDDKHWTLFLLLSRIIDLTYNESITMGETIQLDWLVEEHHVLFKQLFENINLRKKHHNMIHYGNSIRQIGTLSKYETIRFEAKHKFFKTAAVTTNNCNNILHSITKRHQILFLHNKLSEEFLNVEEELVKGNEAEVKSITDVNLIKCIRQIDCAVQTIIINCELKNFNQTIKLESFYLVKSNSVIKIAQIKNIINISQRNLLFIQLYKTLLFDEHYHAFEVESSDSFELVELEKIFHYHSFDVVTNLSITDSRKFVRPYTCFYPN